MLSNLGIEYAITRDYTQAERLYRTSVEVAPSYSRGFYNLGKLLKMMHRYYEAEEVRSLIFNLLSFECRKVVCRLPRQLPTCTSYWLSHKSLGTKSDLQAMLIRLVRYHELHVIQDLLTPSEHLVSMITHHIGGQGPLHSEQYLWLIAPLPGPSQESLYMQCVHVTHVNTQTEWSTLTSILNVQWNLNYIQLLGLSGLDLCEQCAWRCQNLTVWSWRGQSTIVCTDNG